MVIKTRREEFGGIVFFEKPAFVCYVNNAMADALKIKKNENAVYTSGTFSSPLDAHFAVTTRCNMYCKGCYATASGDAIKDVDFEKAKSIIDNLSKLSVLSVSFGGGEPTLYPKIIELAEYTRSKNILPNMTTNGIAMTEDFAEKCGVFGNVHFSIHKPADIETAFHSADIYKKHTGKKAGMNLLLSSEMYPLLEKIVKRADRSSFSKILFLRYKRTAKNADVDGLQIDEKMDEVYRRIKELKKRSRLKFLFDCSSMQTIASAGITNPKLLNKVDANGCLGANAYIAIDVNGNFKPCSFWNETAGSVLELNYENWMTNEKLVSFRNKKVSPHCGSCGYEKICNGGCRLEYLGCNMTTGVQNR